MSVSYLRVEAVNLSNSLADCQDLSTIRGGGLQVLEMAAELVKHLEQNATSVSRGASQGILRIEGLTPDEAEARAREFFSSRGFEHCTIVVSAAEFSEDFGAVRSQLVSRNRFEQMRGASVVYPRLDGNTVCAIDRLRPGRERDDLDSKSVQSDFTHLRRTIGREARRTSLHSKLPGPKDLNDLADNTEKWGNLRDKVALLLFDGKGFGKIQSKFCLTEEAQREFSESIRNSQVEFIDGLTGSTPGPEWLIEGRLRREVLVWGGDEVILVVPAYLGWETARRFLERKVATVQGKPLHYTGALVFCHANSPIHAVRELADSMVTTAKRSQADGDCLVYQVLETFDQLGSSVEAYWKERFDDLAGAQLTLKQVKLLQDHMSLWRAYVSRRRLHQMNREQMNRERAVLTDASIAELFEKSDPSAATVQSLRDLVAQCGQASLVHLLELWDYVAPEARA
jgi:hypothetical protein